LVACDIYRPAAINQLQVVGERAGVKVFEMGQIDPRIIVKEALRFAKDHGNDVVILDTAGRLHIDTELMDELKDLKDLAHPSEIMLVVDAMTGQDAVNVAQAFDEALGIDSVLMSKLDSDTRGGAALSVLAVTGKPIKYVGMGEKLDDFEQFHPQRMASRILGMGDMLTLIEKAESTVSEKDAEKLAKKLGENKFDMNDLLEQLRQIQKMGSIRSIMNMLPGVGEKLKDVDVDERQFLRIEAMITSMTPAEREKPSLINPSRKRRIAAGSGTKVEEVNRLLKQFEQMKKVMKELGGAGKGKGKGRLNRRAMKRLAGMNLDQVQGDLPGVPPGLMPKK
jgi:signal recognition particle subunit SRP54